MTTQSPTTTLSTAKDRDIPIGQLVESTTNPRAMPTGPAKQAFKELVASVASHGILSPLLVRPSPATCSRSCSAIADSAPRRKPGSKPSRAGSAR